MEPSKRKGVVGVHSVNRFVFTVPNLDDAERFYAAFGLDVRRQADRLDLYTHGRPHCWGSVYAGSDKKKLQYLSFGIFEEDVEAFRLRVEKAGACSPHPLSDGSGLWLRSPDAVALQLVAAPKVSPSAKAQPTAPRAVPPGQGAAPSRSKVPSVRPRHLSHLLCFTPDVPRMTQFCIDVLGLRLSDRSRDIIAFMHGAHGSDHHLIAFAKSDAPGLHHTSWDVGSINEVGCGAEQMRNKGYTKGWGVGRHVIGSNYFYYAQDPWGSFCEYSFDIDFVPPGLDWPAADHPPEDSLYVWGPAVPDDFIVNREAA